MRVIQEYSRKAKKDSLWREKNHAKFLKKNNPSSTKEANDLLLKSVKDVKNFAWASLCITKEQIKDKNFLSKLYDIYSENRLLLPNDTSFIAPNPENVDADLLIKYIYLVFPEVPNKSEGPLTGNALRYILKDYRYNNVMTTAEFAQKLHEKDPRTDILSILNAGVHSLLNDELKAELSPEQIEMLSIEETAKIASQLPRTTLIEQIYYNHKDALKYIPEDYDGYKDLVEFAAVSYRKRMDETNYEYEYEGDTTYSYKSPAKKVDTEKVLEEFDKAKCQNRNLEI